MNYITLSQAFSGHAVGQPGEAVPLSGPSLLVQTTPGCTATVYGSNLPKIEATWQVIGTASGYAGTALTSKFAFIRVSLSAAGSVAISATQNSTSTSTPGSGPVTSDDITDASAIGKQLLQAADAAAARAALDVPTTAAVAAKYAKPAGGIPATDLDANPAGRTLLTATSAAERKQVLGIDQVNNTSDANKPISTAQQTALDGKMAATLPALQTVFDTGTAPQKAAFQSSVSGDQRRAVMTQPSIAWTDPEAYVAWPMAKLFYDPLAGGTGRVIVGYNAGTSHVAADRKVFARRRDPNTWGTWGARQIVADAYTGGPHYFGGISHSSVSMAMGKLPDNSYIAIVRHSVNGDDDVVSTRIYKSTDQSASTWAFLTTVTVGGQSAGWIETGGWLIRNNTRLFTTARSFTTNDFYVAYCDIASGFGTWAKVPIDKTAVGGTPLEGALIELADGTIMLLARAEINAYPYVTKRLVYAKSTDGGLTFTPLAFVKDTIHDASNGPPCAIYDAATDVCHLWWTSRLASSDGFGSLYYSRTTGAEFKNGYVGIGERVWRGSPTRDFGYVAAIHKADTNYGLLMWYDGNDSTVAFWQGFFGLVDREQPALTDKRSLVFQTASTLTLPTGGCDIVADRATQLVFSIPADCAAGARWRIQGKGSGGWKIAQAAGQSIEMSAGTTTVGTGGSITSGARYDSIEIECIRPGLSFVASAVGSVVIV